MIGIKMTLKRTCAVLLAALMFLSVVAFNPDMVSADDSGKITSVLMTYNEKQLNSHLKGMILCYRERNGLSASMSTVISASLQSIWSVQSEVLKGMREPTFRPAVYFCL